MPPTEDCPFEVGQEVAILNGHQGKAIGLGRVHRISSFTYKAGCRAPGYRVHLVGEMSGYASGPLGYSRTIMKSRHFIVPATPEHRERYRENVQRAGMVLLVQQAAPRFKDLPIAALAEILATLEAYSPSGRIRRPLASDHFITGV